MESWKEYQEKNKERFLNEMMELLRIPSVSAKSEHIKDMTKCAEEVKKKFLSSGADKAEIMQTEGFPVIYAEKIIDKNKPTVLVYGHYDVQPAEPLELWHLSLIHISEPTRRTPISYAVFCLKKKTTES